MNSVVGVCVALALLVGAGPASAGWQHDKISHSRSMRAVHELENLIAHLEANPYHNSHKAAVIQAAQKTIRELRAALATPWSR